MAGMAGYPHCYFYTPIITSALCYSLPKFLEKAAIPAIVLYSPDK
jgi:hypothetical protein